MRTHGVRVAALLGAALSAAACREDAGMAPDAERHAPRGATAQCLTPASDGAAADSGVVSSRLASIFHRSPAGPVIAAPRDVVVCLSAEEGRWLLRRWK